MDVCPVRDSAVGNICLRCTPIRQLWLRLRSLIVLSGWHSLQTPELFSFAYLDFGVPDLLYLIEFMERETGLEPA